MRNESKLRPTAVKIKRHWTNLALVSFVGLPYDAFASNQLELILDGYAYTVNSDVAINLGQQTVIGVETNSVNCAQANGSMPLNNATMTLVTNNQNIGLDRFQYFISDRLLFMTSETSNVVCDNGLFVDTVFAQGFEPAPSPYLIFSSGFEL